MILDRDGVINEHKHFVNHPNDFYLYPDVAQAIVALNTAGLLVCVATNQGGVGRGFLAESTLLDIHEKMRALLAEEGAVIDDIAYCPHSPEAGCACRKPQPGMLFALQERNGIDLASSYMVGDRETDVEAGRRAGTFTVKIGYGSSAADHVAPSLAEAVPWILEHAQTHV